MIYYKNTVRETTYNNGVYQIKKINNFFKDYLVKDIKVLDIQKFLNSLTKEGLQPITIKLIFNKLTRVFDYGIDIAEIINYRPNFNKIKLPTINSYIRSDILNEKDIEIILNKLEGSIYWYIVQVAMLTGMRKGEILALTWDKIDFKNNIIIVNKSLTYLNTLTLPKNYSSIRKIPMSNKLKNILLDLKSFTLKKSNFSLDGEKIIISNNPGLDFIFRDENGDFITSTYFNYFFNKNFKSKYHFHQFRHYFATTLITSGIPIQQVSKFLGHAQISTTLKMYVGTNKNINMINKLDEIFGQQNDNK